MSFYWTQDVPFRVTSTNNSTTSTDGALVIDGGIGVGKDLIIGGNLNVTGTIAGTLSTAAQPNITSVGTLTGLTSSGAVVVTNTTASTTTTTGALRVGGGAGIAGTIFANEHGLTNGTDKVVWRVVAGNYGTGTTFDNQTAGTNFSRLNIGSSSASGSYASALHIYALGLNSQTNQERLVIQADGTKGSISWLTANSGVQRVFEIYGGTRFNTDGTVTIFNTTVSNSTTTGSLKVSGGLGIAGALYGTTANFSGDVTGTLATATQPNITSVGTLTSLTVSGALNATLATAAQPNVTSVGTLTGLTSSGVVTITNSTEASGPSTGALIVTGGVTSGNHIYAQGNVYAGGVRLANINEIGSTYTAGTNIDITGTVISTINNPTFSGITTISNTTVSNSTTSGALQVAGGVGIAGALFGTTANFSGNITGTLATASQPNITSVGTLSSLTVSGALNATLSTAAQPNVTSVGTLSSLTVSGALNATISTAAQPNITSVGTLTSLTSSGQVNVTNTTPTTSSSTGALLVAGGVGITGFIFQGGGHKLFTSNLTGIVATEGTIFEIGNRTWTNSGTSTSGTLANYYNAYFGSTTLAATNTGVTTTNATSVYIAGAPVSGANNTITNANALWVASGITRLGGQTLVTDATASTSTTSGALIVTGGIGTSGDVYATNINASGNLTGTLATAAQPNITSVGTLSSLTVSGALNATLATAAQPNVTSLGTLTSLTVSGALNATLATAAQPNITSVGTLSSLTVSGALNATLSTAAQPNITSVGTLTGLTSSGQVNITNNTSATSTTTGALTIAGGVGISRSVYISTGLFSFLNATVTATPPTTSGAVFSIGGNTYQNNIAASGTQTTYSHGYIGAPILSASNTGVTTTDAYTFYVAGPPTAGTNMTITNAYAMYVGGNTTISGNVSATSANFSGGITGTLSTAAQPNVTSVGTLTSLTVSGALNATLSTAAQPNVTSVGTLTALTISGQTNLTAGTASTTTTNGTLVVTGGIGVSGQVTASTLAGTLQTAAQPNVTSVGTLTSLTVSGALNATLATAAQPNVTSVGTLTGLTSSGDVVISSATASTSTSSGALRVTGGAGIAGALNVGSKATITYTPVGLTDPVIVAVGNSTTSQILGGFLAPSLTTGNFAQLNFGVAFSAINSGYIGFNYVGSGSTSNYVGIGLGTVDNVLNVFGNSNVAIGTTTAQSSKFHVAGTSTFTGITTITNATASTSRTTGALVVTGGIGTSGDIYAGNNLVLTNTVASSDLPAITLNGNGGAGNTISINMSPFSGRTGSTAIKIDAVDDGLIGAYLSLKVASGSTSQVATEVLTAYTTRVNVVATTTSTSTTTGAFQVAGGVGIAGALYGTTANFSGNITGTLATAAQPNVTSVGTLTSLTVSGSLNATLSTAAQPNVTSVGTLTSLTVSGALNATLSTAAQPNVTSVGTLTSLSSNGLVTFTNTMEAASQSSASVVLSGGLGVAKRLFIAGDIVYPSSGKIVTNTVDESDSGSISISGGGDAQFTRGAYIQLFGQQHATNAGQLIIASPTIAGSIIAQTAGTTRLTIALNGQVSVPMTTVSTSASSGAFVVGGGVGIGGALYVTGTIYQNGVPVGANYTAGTNIDLTSNIISVVSNPTFTGITTVSNTSVSNSTTTGALQVAGGVGIAGALFGTTATFSGNITGTLATAAQPNITSVGTLTGLTSSGVVNVTNATASTSTTTGAVTVAGGMGVAGDLFAKTMGTNDGTNVYRFYNTNTTTGISWDNYTGSASSSRYNLTVSSAAGAYSTEFRLYALGIPGGVTQEALQIIYSSAGAVITPFTTGAGVQRTLTVYSNTVFNTNGTVSFTNTAVSNSTTSGAITVSGGLGVAGALYGTTANFSGNITGTLATAAQPNITSVGTLSSLTVSGALNATLSTAAQPNVTSVGTLTSLTVSGALNATISTAAQPNVTSVGTLSSLTVSGALNATLSTAAQPNVTSVGTLTGLTSSGQVNVTNATASTSSSTGSIVVSGGMGLAGFAFVGGGIKLSQTASMDLAPASTGTIFEVGASTITNTSTAASGTLANYYNSFIGIPTLAATNTGVTTTNAYTLLINGAPAAGTNNTITNSYALGVAAGRVWFAGNQASTTTTNGTLVVTGGIGVSGQVTASTLAGTLQTAAQPNVTSVGTLTAITVSGQTNLTAGTASTTTTNGTLVVTGGIGVSGSINAGSKATFTYTPTTTTDPVISVTGNSTTNQILGGFLAPSLTTGNFAQLNFGVAYSAINSGYIGFNYVGSGSTSNYVGIGLGTVDNVLNIFGNSNVAIGTTTAQSSKFYVAGTSTFTGITSITNATASSTTTSGALLVSGGIGVVGQVTAGTVSATTLTGTLATAAQTNVTSVGTLTALAVSGQTNLTAGTASTTTTNGTLVVTGGIGVSGQVTASTLSGTLQTAAQPNVTSVGTLTSLTVSGALNATLATAAQPNVTSVGTLTSLTVSGALNATLSTAAQPNVTSVGTLTGLTSSGVVNITNSTSSTAATNGALVVTGGIGARNLFLGGAFSSAGMANGMRIYVGGQTITDSSTAASGTVSIVTNCTFAAPTFAATNSNVTITDAYNTTVVNFPAAGTNQTLTNRYILGILGDTITPVNTAGSYPLLISNKNVANYTPTILLENLGGSAGSAVGIDFVTYDSSRSKPSGSLRMVDAGLFTGDLVYYSKIEGNVTNSLAERLRMTWSGGLGVFRTDTTGTPLTAAGNMLDIRAGTFTDNSTAASSSAPNWATSYIGTTTIAASNTSVTVPNASTLYIQSGPQAGANITIQNSYGIWVASGASRFDGNVTIFSASMSTATTSGALVITGGIGAGNMYVGRTYTSVMSTDTGTNFMMPSFTHTNSLTPATHATRAGMFLAPPTFASSGAGQVITNAATLTISGAAIQGANTTLTNAWALHVINGNVMLGGTTVSASTTTGALVVSGGLGVAGALYGTTANFSGNITGTLATAAQPNVTSVGTLTSVTSSGTISTTNTTDSSGVGVGSLQTAGGFAVAKSTFLGGRLAVNQNAFAAIAPFVRVSPGTNGGESSIGFYSDTAQGGTGGWSLGHNTGSGGSGTFGIYSSSLATNVIRINTDGTTLFSNTSAPTSTTTGALRVSGGMGLAGTLFIGGDIIYPTTGKIITNTSDGSDTGSISISGGGNADAPRGAYIQLFGQQHATNAGELILGSTTITGSIKLQTAGTNKMTIALDGVINIANTSDALSTTTGSLQTAGGIYAAKQIVSGGRMYINYASAQAAPQMFLSPQTADLETSIAFHAGVNASGASWIVGAGTAGIGVTGFGFYYANTGYNFNVMDIQRNGLITLNSNTNNTQFIDMRNSLGGSGSTIGIKMTPWTGRTGGTASGIISTDDGSTGAYMAFMSATGTAAYIECMRVSAKSYTGTTLGGYVNVGTLTKAGGTFNIPHPDPQKQQQGYRLRHCFVESPTGGDNIYTFTKQSINNQINFELPDYYRFLNGDSKVFITAVDVLGYGRGHVTVTETSATVTCEVSAEGTYNILVIGSRIDEWAQEEWYGKYDGQAEYLPTEE